MQPFWRYTYCEQTLVICGHLTPFSAKVTRRPRASMPHNSTQQLASIYIVHSLSLRRETVATPLYTFNMATITIVDKMTLPPPVMRRQRSSSALAGACERPLTLAQTWESKGLNSGESIAHTSLALKDSAKEVWAIDSDSCFAASSACDFQARVFCVSFEHAKTARSHCCDTDNIIIL